jgi:hypothetical protein
MIRLLDYLKAHILAVPSKYRQSAMFLAIFLAGSSLIWLGFHGQSAPTTDSIPGNNHENPSAAISHALPHTDLILGGILLLFVIPPIAVVLNWTSIREHPAALITVILSTAGALGGLAYHISQNDEMFQLGTISEGWVAEINVHGEKPVSITSDLPPERKPSPQYRHARFLSLSIVADILLGIIAANAIHLFVSGLINYEADSAGTKSAGLDARAQLTFIALGILAGFAGPNLLPQMSRSFAESIQKNAAQVASNTATNVVKGVADVANEAKEGLAAVKAKTDAQDISIKAALSSTLGPLNDFLCIATNGLGTDPAVVKNIPAGTFTPSIVNATAAWLGGSAKAADLLASLGDEPAEGDSADIKWAYYLLKGRGLAFQHYYGEAIAAFDKANLFAAKDPARQTAALVDKGFAQFNDGKRDEAQKTFESATLKKDAVSASFPTISAYPALLDLLSIGSALAGNTANAATITELTRFKLAQDLYGISSDKLADLAGALQAVKVESIPYSPDEIPIPQPSKDSKRRSRVNERIEELMKFRAPIPAPTQAPSLTPQPTATP